MRVREFFCAVDNAVKDALEKLGLEPVFSLASPPREEMGDLGFPCFAWAKYARKAPGLIAEDCVKLLTGNTLFSQVSVDGAYVNLRLNASALAQALLEDALNLGPDWAASKEAAGSCMLEYSSPNTNKPMHLGHVRNNLLGLSLSRILRFQGQDVTTVNLINDRGIHICKTMLAYETWANGETPQSQGKKGDHFVGELYVRFDREFRGEFMDWSKNNEVPADFGPDEFFNSPHSSLGSQTRDMLRRWEASEPRVMELWRRMNSWVLDGFNATYSRMGCEFDLTQFESETFGRGRELVLEGHKNGLFRKREDGAVVLDLQSVGGEGEKVLLRSDGTSLYMTQDIGTAAWRLENADRLVYVVGDEQLYHFKLLFGVLDLLFPGALARCQHLAYGMIRLPEGRMKSRQGTVVDADCLMDEMRGLAMEEIERRCEKAHYEGLDEKEKFRRAEIIGQAALKYHMFRFTPPKSFEYNPSESIDFNGQTGPYCLYTYARSQSVLRKAANSRLGPPDSPGDVLTSSLERGLIMQLASFPRICNDAARNLDPSRIAEFVYSLCRTFNNLFADRQGHPLANCPDPNLREARLMLVEALGNTIKKALELLGIETLEEM